MKKSNVVLASTFTLLMSLTSINANAAPVTGTAVLLDGNTTSAPNTFYVALPKGSCSLLMSSVINTGKYDKAVLAVAATKVDGSYTDQKLCRQFHNTLPLNAKTGGPEYTTKHYSYGISPLVQCASSITLTDESPFLRVWVADIYGDQPSNVDDLATYHIRSNTGPWLKSSVQPSYLSVSYSCE